MTPKRGEGTALKVFSGKEAKLNYIILLILFSGKFYTKYDLLLQVRKSKGFRHVVAKTIYRRVHILDEGHWIVKVGEKITKPGWPTELYSITIRGKAALKLNQKNIEDFLKNATDKQLSDFVDLLQ